MSPLFRSSLAAILLAAGASGAFAATPFTERTLARPFTTLDAIAPGPPTEPIVLGLGFPIVVVEVGVAGDVDANGASDWITGTPLYAPAGPLSAVGRVVVTRRNQNGTVLGTKTYDGQGESAYFGASVASLGDIDADGYDDFAIGSPGYNSGAGRVTVYKGTANGPGNSSWLVEGTPGSFLGYKVAYAGDVNGDGFDDLLASAPGATDALTQQGAVHCYLGGPNGLSQAPVRTWLGDSAFDGFGWGLAGGGDVNADGYADVVIGAPGYGNGEVDEGRVSLYLGGPGGPAAASAWSYESDTISEQLGQVIALPGDVNADGYGEIALGLPNADFGGTDNGRIMVFGGGPFLFALPLIYDRGGDSNGEGLGWDIAPAGDQNGDGFADVLSSAPFGGPFGLDGRWFILFGSPITNSFDTSLSFDGIPGARAGLSVSGGGDQGDGVPDVLVGYFVPFIKEAGATIAAPAGPQPGPGMINARGFTIHEVGYLFARQFAQGINETGFGISSVIMDINGDGYDDAIAGGTEYTESLEGQGIVRAYFGDDDGFGDSPFPFAGDGRPVTAGGGPPPSWNVADWTFTGPLAGANFTFSMANAGDVNGDGYEDLLVGAPSASPDSSAEGAAYLFYGGADGPNTQPDWISEGQSELSFHGYSVASAGDVNQDGYADFLIGSPLARVGGNFSAGRAGLYYGSATGPVHVPAREWFGTAANQNLGLGVSGVGDVDADGYPDVVIADPGYANGQVAEGRIRVYRGSAAGLSALPYFEWESDHVNGQIGWFCRAAGDLNGDGFADFMTGNPMWSNPEEEEGSVQVFLGGPSTISVATRLELEPAAPGAHFGTSLSTAGDFDADGYSDIIAGAPDLQDLKPIVAREIAADGSPADRLLGLGRAVAGIPGSGAAYVHFGDVTGVESTWRYRFLGPTGSSTGRSVAGGGDLNGDGWPDVVFTAPFDDGVKVSDNGIVSAAFSNIIQDGAAKPRRLLRTDGTTPLAIGGRSDSPNSFRLAGIGRHPMGRGKARMQWQAKAPAAALDGTGVQSSTIVRTGVPTSELGSTGAYTGTATGLATGERYRIRTRYATRNPYFPRSPWFTSARNGVREADLRTFGPTGSVDVGDDAVAARLSFAAPWPNPLTSASGATLSFSLPAAGRVTIDAYDAQGRRVARVHQADAPAGRSTVTWSGHGDGGRALPRGLYFLRLESGNEVETVKAVLAR